MPRASIYFRPEEDPLYQRFKQIVRREGSNVSKHLMDYIKGYVDFHDPGNPQSRITSFATGGSHDVGAIEGELRQIFKSRGEKGVILTYKDILQVCRAHFTNPTHARAVCDRVCEWLTKIGEKVWR